MGMIKTISGRFGHVISDRDSDSDDGANPLPQNKRDKRSKKPPSDITAGPAPAIFQKREEKDLKKGHNQNKVNGVGISQRHIIVQPSMRHLNYAVSMRDIASQLSEEDFDPAEPPTRNLVASQPSMRTLGMNAMQKKSSMRNVGMNSIQKNSSMRNVGMNAIQKNSSMRNVGMNAIQKKSSMRNMNMYPDKKSSLEKKTIVRNMDNGMRPMTSIKEKSSRLIDTIDEMGSVSKMNSIEETTQLAIGTIVEEDPVRNMSSIDEKSVRIVDTGPMRSLTSIDESSKEAINAISNMRNLNSVKSTRVFNTIEEESSEVMDTIDEKEDPIDEKGASNSNQDNTSNANKLNGSNNSKSSSTSTKSTASTSTKSTASTSTKSTTSLSNKNIIDIDIKSTIKTEYKANNYNNTSNNGLNKSNHSTKSEISKNTDNRSTKSRDRKQHQQRPRMKRTSIGVPHQFDRDRPSTALITRKELEEILNAKRKEEMMDTKTMPPMNGTLSTELWVDAANKDNNEDHSSHCSDLEESPGSQKRENIDLSEYDIKFTDFSGSEEEVTIPDEHMDSFDEGDFDLTDSMDRRCTTIRFDEYDELQTCLHINDYTKNEITRSWYKRDDYDKMVDLARKTASKAVKREKEMKEEVIARISQSPPRRRVNSKSVNFEDPATKSDDDNGNFSADNKSIGSGRSKRSTGTADGGKRKKPIEYRGLEAWTPEGSSKCRMLKETAIELVWNEQSRQWEEGAFDPEAISHVYIPVAKKALDAARLRAIADEKMVRKLIEQEHARKEKKRSRTVLTKSKAALKKTAKSTGKGLVQGGAKVITQTGKVGMRIGKRGARATLGVVTADPRMIKEAVTQKKKRECKHQMIINTSQAAHERDVEEMEESGSLSLQDSNAHFFSNGRPGLQRPGLQRPALGTSVGDKFSDKVSDVDSRDCSSRSFGEADSRRSHADSESNLSSSPGKKSRLKLLGVVPIPGTQKMYSEDRREQRAKERLSKMTRRPSWEASSIAGKY